MNQSDAETQTMTSTNGKTTDLVETTSDDGTSSSRPPIDWAENPLGYQLTRSGQLLKGEDLGKCGPPKVKVLPPNHPGSIDWILQQLFGDRSTAIKMIESIAASDEDSEWIKFCYLYRDWENRGY